MNNHRVINNSTMNVINNNGHQQQQQQPFEWSFVSPSRSHKRHLFQHPYYEEFSSRFRKVTTNARNHKNEILPAYGNNCKKMSVDNFEPASTDFGLSVFHQNTPSPLGSDSGIEGDCTEGNLSWLLNYKINELPPVPDGTNLNDQESTPTLTTLTSKPQYQIIPSSHQNDFRIGNEVRVLQFNPQSSAAYDGNKILRTETIQIQDNKVCATNGRYAITKKPPFTYTELIEHALVEKGELTVSGIYQWISDHFPYYKQNDDRWKNSVRHNLSINPHFRKGSKAVHGAGHLWTIAQRDDMKTWNIKKQKIEQFIESTMSEYSRQKQNDIELANATASILPHDANQATYVQYQPQNVEVEYVIDMSGGLGDFLCPPVTKEQVASEYGLGGDYLITDLNPNALGLNISEAEILSGNAIYDDMNFQCYELQTE